LGLGLLVTVGARATTNVSGESHDGVLRAFRDLMEMTGQPEPTPISRDAAIVRARRAAATAYRLDPARLSLSVEEHHPAENSWALGLRTTAGDDYEVVIGFVDGYAGSSRVQHERRVEVSDSIGSE
jgi:hypothetical protein